MLKPIRILLALVVGIGAASQARAADATRSLKQTTVVLSPTSARSVQKAAAAAQPKLGAWLRKAHQAVADCVAKHKGQGPGLARFLALAELRIEKVCLLLTRYRASDFRDRLVRQELAQADALARDIASGETPKLPKQGFIESAYYSALDGSPQPYCYYLPKAKPRKGKYGLFVFLHGYVSYLDKANWIEFMYSDKLNALAEAHGLIPMLPFGRSNTEFMGVGEVDVLAAIEEMKRFHPIDDSRVFLSGGSMGGSGVYTIACHYPQLFAGIAPIAGRYSYYFWKGIDRNRYLGFKRIQTDIDYAEAMPQNLFNVPAHIFHGGGDSLVKVGQSRGMSKLLKSLGQRVEYVEFSNADHWIWDRCFEHPSFAKWLQTNTAPASPPTVKFKTYTLKYDRAYWVQINRFKRWGPPAEVVAQATKDGKVNVTTKNVAEMTLSLDKALVGDKDSVTVVVDGKPHKQPLGQVRIQLAKLSPNGLAKTHDICGPAREAYCSKFIMVFGTQQPGMADLQTAANAGREWIAFAKGRATLKADEAVTKDDIANCNLILFGDTQSNSIIRNIAAKLPIKITPAHFLVGKRKIARPAASLLMIYPNPLNPKHYVLLDVGTRWGKYLAINHKLDHVPDFIVFKNTRSPDGNNDFVTAGYFDNHWQLCEQTTWDAGKGNAGKTSVE